MTHKLLWAACHLSTRHLATFNIFLTLSKSHRKLWGHTEILKAADAVLVDVDVPDGWLLLQTLASQELSQALIAYGERRADFPPVVLHLQKPPSAANFLRVLDQAAGLYSVSHLADATAAETAESLLEYLVKNKDKVIGLTEDGAFAMVFDKKGRCCYSNLPIAEIQERLLAAADHYGRPREVRRDELAAVAGGLARQDLDAALWHAVLATSQGQLYAELPADGHYRLHHWPNLKLLARDPAYMKFATALRQGGSLSRLADATGEPLTNLVDFVNACFVLNYLDPVSVPDETTEPASAEPVGTAGTASSLLDFLVGSRDRVIGLTENGRHVIVFDKKSRCCYSSMPAAALHDLLLGAAERSGSLCEISRDELPAVTAGLDRQELDPALWNAMLVASHGRLYANLPPDGFYKLHYWPNLKLLAFNSAHMKFATILRRGVSLRQLADKTQEPMVNVIDFVNACFALDYLDAVKAPEAPAAPGPGAAIPQMAHALFARIRSRLGI